MTNFNQVFIVAEISANHGQSLKRAINMIKTAARCGADAVKFQCYTPDTLTIKCNNKYFKINHPQWGNQTLYELYQKAYTPWKWFKKLKTVAQDNGIIFFATCFDKSSVDFLEELEVPFHKISSFELTDLPLIEYVAKTKKPLILSTGMSDLTEIKAAVTTAKKAGVKNLTLLKCVSSYPAETSEMNLATIPDMKKRFKVNVGLSDHTKGTAVSVGAVCFGARMIEKHFIISKKLNTPDSFFSIDKTELKKLVEDIRCIEQAIGKVNYNLTQGMKKNRFFGRSLFAVKDIKKGEKFTETNIRSIRPNYGLPPCFYYKILGKKDIKYGTPLKLEHIE